MQKLLAVFVFVFFVLAGELYTQSIKDYQDSFKDLIENSSDEQTYTANVRSFFQPLNGEKFSLALSGIASCHNGDAPKSCAYPPSVLK